jgi:hypothetical protein
LLFEVAIHALGVAFTIPDEQRFDGEKTRVAMPALPA